MGEFSGRTLVITGGGSGVGFGVSRAFLAAGATVVICGRRMPEELPAAAGREAIFVQTDIRDPIQSQNLIDKVMAETGRLDVLINNAGGSPPVRAERASPKFTESIIRLNLIAPVILAQQAFPHLAKNKTGGCVINIASISGVRASPGTVAYGAAKAGLINAGQSLAQEWGADRVRVNAIVAGLIRTRAAEGRYGGQASIEQIEDTLPMRRMARVDDIANACLFLASERSEYISAAALEVHGGGELPAFLQLAEKSEG